MYKVTKFMRAVVSSTKARYLSVCVALTAAVLASAPASSLATEGATATKVKEIATDVGTEGVEIVLGILAALVTLLVAIIIIPKAVGLIKRFI